jgi:hypothetical protein
MVVVREIIKIAMTAYSLIIWIWLGSYWLNTFGVNKADLQPPNAIFTHAVIYFWVFNVGLLIAVSLFCAILANKGIRYLMYIFFCAGILHLLMGYYRSIDYTFFYWFLPSIMMYAKSKSDILQRFFLFSLIIWIIVSFNSSIFEYYFHD